MKKSILALTALFLMLFTAPAMANVTVDFNGRYFNSDSSTLFRNNLAMVPGEMIAQTLGAELTVKDNQVVLQENDSILEMAVGETKALANGQETVMPAAPELIDGKVWLPLRFVYESLGAKVSWSGLDQMIGVDYQETRNGLNALEMLAKASQVMQEANSYKMLVDTKMDMNIVAPDENNSDVQKEIATQASGKIEAYTQYDPVLMYLIEDMDINIPELQQDTLQNVHVEMLFNEDGMYMNMPEVGWVDYNIPGLDMQALLKQSMAQDPLASIETMKNSGMAISYNNDIEKDGQKYWVIDVKMGRDAMQTYMQQMQQQLTQLEQSTEITDALKNMDMDMNYRMLINQENYQTENMNLQTAFSLNMEVPAEDKTENVKMDVDMQADYHISDYGLTFDTPDVSDAKSLEEIIPQAEEKAEETSTQQ